jgi:hypothetical protein
MKLHVGKRLKLRWSTSSKVVPGPSGDKALIPAPVRGTITAIGVAGSFRISFDAPPRGRAERFWYRADQLNGFEEVTR